MPVTVLIPMFNFGL